MRTLAKDHLAAILKALDATDGPSDDPKGKR